MPRPSPLIIPPSSPSQASLVSISPTNSPLVGAQQVADIPNVANASNLQATAPVSSHTFFHNGKFYRISLIVGGEAFYVPRNLFAAHAEQLKRINNLLVAGRNRDLTLDETNNVNSPVIRDTQDPDFGEVVDSEFVNSYHAVVRNARECQQAPIPAPQHPNAVATPGALPQGAVGQLFSVPSEQQPAWEVVEEDEEFVPRSNAHSPSVRGGNFQLSDDEDEEDESSSSENDYKTPPQESPSPSPRNSRGSLTTESATAEERRPRQTPCKRFWPFC